MRKEVLDPFAGELLAGTLNGVAPAPAAPRGRRGKKAEKRKEARGAEEAAARAAAAGEDKEDEVDVRTAATALRLASMQREEERDISSSEFAHLASQEDEAQGTKPRKNAKRRKVVDSMETLPWRKVDLSDEVVFGFQSEGFCFLEELQGFDVEEDADGLLKIKVCV
jgi:hypothetical protein